jgi:hypothetical protein
MPTAARSCETSVVHATTRPAAPGPVASTDGGVPPLARTDTELVYEVECALDPEIAADFDAWLPGHVQMVLESPGFLGAELLRPVEPAPDGRVRRVNRYRVRDRAALETYLEQRAPALRQDGAVRFGERASYTRRVLAAVATHAPAGGHARCANCDARLLGPYCAQCGQHARESARSMGTLFHDAWHVLTHVDGRFWRTLRRLAFSPGLLTREYFCERRASYIPPFRLYLVLSLLFFGVASLTSAFEQGPLRLEQQALTPEDRAELDRGAEALSKTREKLGASGAGGALAGAVLGTAEQGVREAARGAGGGGAAADLRSTPATADATTSAATRDAARPRTSANRAIELDGSNCDHVHVNPKWLEPALRDACHRAQQDGGRSLAHAFVANIPKMMFVFLPLMAAVMLLLYWRPRRYYVEHLVFFLHVHAALFLVLTALVTVGFVGSFVPPLAAVAAVLGFATFAYAAWYVWRAMRVHYGNGRGLTFAKFAIIAFCYVVFLAASVAGTALVSALTA